MPISKDRLRPAPGASPPPQVSVVTPAFNEAANLPVLYQRLRETLESMQAEWEWVIVDDHSPDGTFAVISELARSDHRVRGLRLARNLGSHRAVGCGLDICGGRCAVVMAADLQDPPELLPELVAKWRSGAQVVWAVRAAREGEKTSTLVTAGLFYWLLRHVAGLQEAPGAGADFFLLDRRVIAALREFRESNLNIVSLITWMGFRQEQIHYVKRARVHGRSGWTLSKKVKLAIDSITSFSYLPLRLMSCLGIAVSLLGLGCLLLVVFSAPRGHPQPGCPTLMAALLIMSGFQMLMMGVLGEYLWRALDEARRRPRYWIEDSVGFLDSETGDSAVDPTSSS